LLRNRATTNPRLWGPTATLFIHFCNTVTNISRYSSDNPPISMRYMPKIALACEMLAS
jgi:hypothetical protein